MTSFFSQFSQPVPPMSNTERQREFRKRHPGYYGRLHRKRRAGAKAMRETEIEARLAVEQKAAPLAVLMLPAPALVDPLWNQIAKWGPLAESLNSRVFAD